MVEGWPCLSQIPIVQRRAAEALGCTMDRGSQSIVQSGAITATGCTTVLRVLRAQLREEVGEDQFAAQVALDVDHRIENRLGGCHRTPR